jgi:adenine-specific DNA-methyltransferase
VRESLTIPTDAEVADALADFGASLGCWNLVMGNPPFDKVKDTPPLRAKFRRSLHGHPNFYGLLVDVAVPRQRADRGVRAVCRPAGEQR